MNTELLHLKVPINFFLWNCEFLPKKNATVYLFTNLKEVKHLNYLQIPKPRVKKEEY